MSSHEFKNGFCIYFQSVEDSIDKPDISYQSLEHDHTKIECPICLDVVYSSFAIISKCNHAICIDCCKKMKDNTCPMCRSVFTGKSKWGYWDYGNWVDFEHIMLQNIKISKKRLENLSYRKKKKKSRFRAITEDMHLAKSRALVAAIIN
jgi:hypothetical protein